MTHKPNNEVWPELAPEMSPNPGMNNIEGKGWRRFERLRDGGYLDGPDDDPIGDEHCQLLCSFCSNLKLTAQDFIPCPIDEEDATRETYHRLSERPFKEFLSETTCPLCQLIKHAVQDSNQAAKAPIDVGSLLCTIFLVRFSCYWDHHDGWESFCFLSLQCSTIDHPLEVRYRDAMSPHSLIMQRTVNGFRSLLSADLLPVDCARYPTAFLGRRVDHLLSPPLVQRWLRQCEVVHGKLCFHSEGSSEPPGDQSRPNMEIANRFDAIRPLLYFIDVKESRLCRLPDGGRFVALSYIWGQSQSLLTTRDSIERLQQPGSLLEAAPQLSAVINDAIALTADIGERFIWIDSLCIVQDDGETKQACINKMDVVYSNAIITIVAAEGTDTTTGLPGVRSRPRPDLQKTAIVAPHLELISLHHFGNFSKSAYSSRAWTFQECFCSPRRLIFVNGQVIFKCGWDSPFREDLLSEYQIFGIQDYVYKLHDTNWVDRSTLVKCKRYAGHLYFRDIIADFTSRHLSHQGDIINAFAGLAALFAHDCGTELLFGLIKQALTLGMLWYSPRLFDKDSRRGGFPSWSWCGWIGPVTIHSPEIQFAKWTARYSWINWYIFSEASSTFHHIPQDFTEVSNEDLQLIWWGSASSDSDVGNMFVINQQDSEPKYQEFLKQYPDPGRRHCDGSSMLEHETVSSAPTLIDSPDNTAFTNYTLLFRTLAANVYISPYDPNGHYTEGYRDHVFIYDLKFRFIGFGFLTYEAFWDAAFEEIDSGGKGIATSKRYLRLKMAIIAGPITPQLERDDGIINTTPTSTSVPHLHVLLLTSFIPVTNSQWKNLERYYERAGIGVVAYKETYASMRGIRDMEGIDWEDIIIQ